MSRLQFNAVGTITEGFSVDPEEYRGLTIPQMTTALVDTLRSINPKASFFLDDCVEFANSIATELEARDSGT